MQLYNYYYSERQKEFDKEFDSDLVKDRSTICQVITKDLKLLEYTEMVKVEDDNILSRPHSDAILIATEPKHFIFCDGLPYSNEASKRLQISKTKSLFDIF